MGAWTYMYVGMEIARRCYRQGRAGVVLRGPVADAGQGARMSKGLIKGIFKMGEVNDSAFMERDAYQVKLNFFKLRILV